MSEDLENKLNELLGIKKQLEELTAEKKKTNTDSILGQYKTKYRLNLILFIIRTFIGLALVTFGAICLQFDPDVLYITSPTLIIAGLVIIMVAKQGWQITQSKFLILLEMKQFEIRITALLEKQSGQTQN